MIVEAEGIYFSTIRRTASPMRHAEAADQLAEESGLGRASTPCSRGEKINVTEKRAVLHVALARAAGTRRSSSMARMLCRKFTPCSTRWPRFQPRAQRRVERAYGQAHSQRHQHRHRRVRPRSGDGLRGAEVLQRTRDDVPFRVERRRHGFRGERSMISILPRPCSSSLRRPSQRSRL